jgi:hypothetical protein
VPATAPPPPTPAPAPTPPAPAAPAASPPSAPPSAAPAENPFAELDGKFAAFDKKPETTQGKGKEGAAPAAPAAPAKPEAGKRPADNLRAELEKWKTEAATKTQLATEYEKRIKEFELRGKDTEALTTRLTQVEHERDEAQAKARRASKEMDPAFMKKWQEPFDEVSLSTEDLITQMDVTDPESGEARRGTKEDLQYLYSIDSPTKRNAEIRKMFGDDAITVIPKLDRMKELNSSFRRALAQEQSKAAELDKQERGAHVQAEQQWQTAVDRLGSELAEKIEEYHDTADDKEAAELRQKGYGIFDSKPANRQEGAVKFAHVRQMVAAHYPMKLQITRLKAELTAAKDELAKLKESNPNTTTRRSSGGGAPPSDDGLTWEERARKELA